MDSPTYFADENALGFAKRLRAAGREDIVYPGHERLPEVPLGALDLDWMPIVASRRLIVVTRDRHLRTRPMELVAYRENGIRSIHIGAKDDLTPDDQARLFLQHLARIERLGIKLGEGPWALSLARSGVREVRLRAGT